MIKKTKTHRISWILPALALGVVIQVSAADQQADLTDSGAAPAALKFALHPGQRVEVSAGDRNVSEVPSFELSAAEAATPADQPKRAHEADVDEINNKLNNPGTDLAFLNFKFVWNEFKGDLPGSTSQDSVTLAFQPVFPFERPGEGNNFIIRPTIPVVWRPYFNGKSWGFDEEFGLGDAELVALFAHTDKEKGVFYGAGPTMQFPTHTDDVLGHDSFRLGPAAYAGKTGEWGAVGMFAQHWWNICGGDGYFATTELNPFYWFSVGNGWQLGGSPIINHDWAADASGEGLVARANLGLQKTVKIGKSPVRFRFEGVYYIRQPDLFGPHWGLQLTITPVIPNPFEGLAASK